MNIIKWSIYLGLTLLIALVLVSQNAEAKTYCSGQILSVLVQENGIVCVQHSGSGSEFVCVNPNASDAIKGRILSLLVTGWMSGSYVQLEFSSGNCGMMPRFANFSYVMLAH